MKCDIQKNIKSIILIDAKSAKDFINLLDKLKEEGFFDKKNNYSKLKLKFCLPYLFHIKDGDYIINIDSEMAKCSIKRMHTDKVVIKENEDASLTTKANSFEIDKLINAELIRDSSGEFWYMDVEMELPFTENEIIFFENKTNIPNDALRTGIIVNKLFKFINRFITCYRNSFFEPQIKEVNPLDLRLIFLDQGESYLAINFMNQLPLINCKESDKVYNVDQSKIEDFQKRLGSGSPIPIWVDLINNAHLYLLRNNYRMCVIECYIVLESYIKEIIDEFLPQKFNDNLFKKFYKSKKERLSLNDLYDQFAEISLGFSFKESHPTLWEKFIKFKQLRNNAVHKKLVSIEETDAYHCLKNTEKIINLFQNKRYE